MPADPATIWTIGHSTHTLEEFLALLGSYRIESIADVRRFPSSLRHPHFASEALAQSLPAHGLGYHWIPSLGGRRKVQPDSPNTAWRNASFQGYADYTATPEFADGLAELLRLAAAKHRDDVCGGAVVALPSVHRFRCVEAARHRGDPHHGCHSQHGASVHVTGPHRRWTPELRGCAERGWVRFDCWHMPSPFFTATWVASTALTIRTPLKPS